MGMYAVAVFALAAAVLLRPGTVEATTAADVCDAMADPCELGRELAVDPGSTLDFGTRAFAIKAPNGRLLVDAGDTLSISAGSMLIETGAGGRLRTAPAGSSAISIVVGGAFTVTRVGVSSVAIDMTSNAEPGTLDIQAGGDVTIGGEIHAQGAESGGEVFIGSTGGRITLADRILADSGFFGGFIVLNATGPIEVTADGGMDVSSAVGFGSIELDTRASLVHAGRLVAKARFSEAFGCDGGTLSLGADGDITIDGAIDGDGDVEGCVGGILTMLAGGNIAVNGDIDLSGGPNGLGGSIQQATAGSDFVQTAPIRLGSGGLRGWGGDADIAAGRRLHIGALLDLGGGPQVDLDTGDRGRGGELVLTAGGTLEIAGEISGDGADYGSLAFTTLHEDARDVPGRIVVTGDIHAVSSADEDVSGDVRLEACEIEIAATGIVRKTGPASRNLLRASAAMRIAGTLDAGPAGTNALQHRDLTLPPLIVPGAVVTPTATVTATPAEPLLPCACTLDPQAAGLLCSDDNVCTREACDPTVGCTSVPLAGEGVSGCDDGNACNGREACEALVCRAGPVPVTDDGDPCTDDGACDPATGVAHTPKTGFAAATCRMDRIEAALSAANVPGDISEKALKKVQKLARGVRSAVEKLASATPKRRTKLLKAATKKLRRLDQAITSPKTSIKPQLATLLTTTSNELRGALTQLQ